MFGSRICSQEPREYMNCRALFFVFETLLAVSSIAAQQPNSPATYSLKPTPKTVAWGYYDAKAAPVLRVKSGDTVEIQTLITNSPKRLGEAGPPPGAGGES